MELSLGGILVCPAGNPGRNDLKFEMQDMYRLESRQQEIATVNKVTAPGLMQAFIDGYGHAARVHVQLEWELDQATKHMNERKAVVFLEVAPEYLQKNNLVRAANPSGSEDQRLAVLARDKEYQSLSDRVSMLTAAVEFLKVKMKKFEMSYQAVKKVYDSLSSTNALAPYRPAGATPYVGDDETPNMFAPGGD